MVFRTEKSSLFTAKSNVVAVKQITYSVPRMVSQSSYASEDRCIEEKVKAKD